MKKIFLFVFLLIGFLHQTGANPICIVNTEEPSVGIGVNDLIIVSDVDKIAQYSKLKNLSERALDQVKIGNDAYEEGVKFLQQGKSKDAITAFKTAFKNYKRAKYDEDALSFVNVQLAISHAISTEARDQKKVSRYMDLLTKGIFKEKLWAYNIAILKSTVNQEQQAADLLEAVIKEDKYFFKAYGNLSALYSQYLNEPKKAEKVLSKLNLAQEMLAEKERKEQLASARKKDKNGSQKPTKKDVHPEGVSPAVESLVAKGDAKSIMKFESIASFNDRTRKKINEGKTAYEEGVALFNNGEYDLASKSFKSSLKKYTQAKAKQATLNYITVQLAMAYFRSPNDRNKKKVVPLLEDLSKEIYNERDWVYNLAVMYHGLGRTERSIELLKTCTDLDKYFLIGYQNQIALFNEQEKLKEAKKTFREHEKYKDELTQIYKRYVRTGEIEEGVDFSFLNGAIFRVALGDFNEYQLPVDIYLHDELLIVPLGNDYFSYTCGQYDSFLKAERYLKKIAELRYPQAHVVAFKEGIRTDFSNTDD
jgi:tetratricopeptide (TPR) repeat protein